MKPIRTVVVALAAAFGLLAGAASPAYANFDVDNPAVWRAYPAPPAGHLYAYSSDDLYIQSTSLAVGYFYMDGFHLTAQGPHNAQGFGGYFGLQTQLYPIGGQGVIFSIWGAIEGAANIGGVYTGTELGVPYVSLRASFGWTVGHWYRLFMQRQVVTGSKGELQTLIHAAFYDLTVPASYYLGWIRVPNTWGGFDWNGQKAQLTEEYYPNSYPSCAAVPRSEMAWGLNQLADDTGVWVSQSASVGSGVGTCALTEFLGEPTWRETVGL